MPRPLLSEREIVERLASRPGWALEEGALRRKLVLRDHREAMAFLVRIAFEAEELDHHPDVALSYKRVGLSLSTHDSGGVTEADFALLERIDRVLETFAA